MKKIILIEGYISFLSLGSPRIVESILIKRKKSSEKKKEKTRGFMSERV
jgi:hypothetical protein